MNIIEYGAFLLLVLCVGLAFLFGFDGTVASLGLAGGVAVLLIAAGLIAAFVWIARRKRPHGTSRTP
jgi:small neutral amino acid transporter SnatA (MarC family)